MLAIFLAAVLLFGTVACTGNTGPATTIAQTTTTAPTDPDATQPPKMVSVTLDANNGSSQLTVVTLPANACYGQLPEAQLEDYVFLGWFTDPVAGEPVTADMLLVSQQDHTLYAHWQPRTDFTVTLDPNGGRISPYTSQVTVTQDKAYGTLPTPVWEGYTFLGWYTDPEAGELVDADTVFTSGEDHTLYAHWEYDALAYWTHVLHSRVQTIPQCRRVVVYLEKSSNYKTFLSSTFLSDAGAINPAEGLMDETVTDDWIRSANPYVIIKLTVDVYMGAVNKVAMQRRFPDMEIYIFSANAVNGNAKVQLYYRLQLAKILYPEYFADVDLAAVAAEFEINPKIY